MSRPVAEQRPEDTTLMSDGSQDPVKDTEAVMAKSCARRRERAWRLCSMARTFMPDKERMVILSRSWGFAFAFVGVDAGVGAGVDADAGIGAVALAMVLLLEVVPVLDCLRGGGGLQMGMFVLFVFMSVFVVLPV